MPPQIILFLNLALLSILGNNLSWLRILVRRNWRFRFYVNVAVPRNKVAFVVQATIT